MFTELMIIYSFPDLFTMLSVPLINVTQYFDYSKTNTEEENPPSMVKGSSVLKRFWKNK